MSAFLYFLLSIPLYLLSIFTVRSFAGLNFNSGEKALFTALIIGFAAGTAVFIFISRFTKLYVFGHEAAHWIFAKLFMRDTKSFEVGSEGGAVHVHRPNIWISLAPYFYPTFTILWVPTWFAFKYFEKDYVYSTNIFFGILAFTWSYHVVLTFHALRVEQSDLKRYGKPLSLSLIIFFNFFMIYLFLSLFTDDPLVACRVFWETVSGDISGVINYFKDLLRKE